jgi:hypothetical protein
MKKVMLFTLLLGCYVARSQRIIQPVSAGDYWEINDYQRRLPELADENTFPKTISFPNGSIGVSNVKANRIIGANEIYWTIAGAENVTDFAVEYSRDLHNFEQAGRVHLLRTDGVNSYVFRHTFIDRNLVYYRLAILRDGQVLAYTPAVQLLDEEARTKIFPTLVTGSTFYVQTGQPFERLQVVNEASKPVYEKALDKETGTITVGLPALPRGIYFVRLLAEGAPQHVQRIVVQ